MIYVKRSIVKSWISWVLAGVLWVPVPAWAGRSTEGLIYLWLPFYIAVAIFLTGTVVSLIYLIICRFQAKKNRYEDIVRTKIIRQRLFWIWTVTVLFWIMLIFSQGMI